MRAGALAWFLHPQVAEEAKAFLRRASNRGILRHCRSGMWVIAVQRKLV
jgi:hypothetical protein